VKERGSKDARKGSLNEDLMTEVDDEKKKGERQRFKERKKEVSTEVEEGGETRARKGVKQSFITHPQEKGNGPSAELHLTQNATRE